MASIEFIEERIATTEALIVSVESAIAAVTAGAQSYTLDTGQSRQTVTKANLTEFKNLLKYLEKERLPELEAELSDAQGASGKSAYGRPAF